MKTIRRRLTITYIVNYRMVALGFALIQCDPTDYQENDIDALIWNDCYYKEISKQRKVRHMSTEEYLNFLKEGIRNYEYMVKKLKKSEVSDHVFCSYSFLIHMGDLFRYIYLEEPRNSESFSSSQECYLKAIQYDPSQGNAYHQLAVLAVYKKSYCQALYYCIRAITCPSPFSTAFSNIPFYFSENTKNIAKFQSLYPNLNKHHCNEVFPATFSFLETPSPICRLLQPSIPLFSTHIFCLLSQPVRLHIELVFGARQTFLHCDASHAGHLYFQRRGSLELF